MGRVIGIDLGTTYSVVGIMDGGKAKVVPTLDGRILIPSVYAETPRGERLAGAVAMSQAAANPERTVSSVKRHMGTDFRAVINGRAYSPQEISAWILKHVKGESERALGEPVTKAVITVPAYFNDGQRQATEEAGQMAGLEVLRIINEPTAAALAYGLHQEDIQTVVVWDLGGGTFDVSILELGKGIFHVKAVNGDTQLGGDDWDERLAAYAARLFAEHHEVELQKDPRAWQSLKEACERSKRSLSLYPNVGISVALPGKDGEGWRMLKTRVDRETFENMTADLRERLVRATRQSLADAGVSTAKVDRVILVGGSTRMPIIRRLVWDFFGQEPYTHLNPDEVVALGAGVQAGILTGQVRDRVLIDVTPLSLGVEVQGGLFARIVTRNASIPLTASQIFTNAEDQQTEMSIHILQGEREMAKDNFSLGRFELSDIPPLPKGKAQVEVSFQIDVNGMVTVSAEELYTGEQAEITVDAIHLLSPARVSEVLREAQSQKEPDNRAKETAEAHIRAADLIQSALSFLQQEENTDPPAFMEKVMSTVQDLKQAIAYGDLDTVREGVQVLEGLLEEISEIGPIRKCL